VLQNVSYTTGTSSTAAFLGGSSTGTSILYSGRAADGTGENFRGQVDDLRIYNYALSSQQVLLLYNGGVAVRFTP